MPKSPQLTKGSGPFGKAVFNWMKDLSDAAREKLEQSEFICIDKTRVALKRLIDSANRTDSILAVCGYKGDYSTHYYQRNFAECKGVKRIFSYEAIYSEITQKNVPYALNGLVLHLNEQESNEDCDVKVLLIKKGELIKNMKSGIFDPPLSFGLTILLDEKHLPKQAVVHWEMGAEPLKHMIDIEGVIIDGAQEELLHELKQLHEQISESNLVLSTERGDRKAIVALREELEALWARHSTGKERV